MKKYAKYVLLLLASVIWMLPVQVKAATESDFTYGVNGDKQSVTITGYTGTDPVVVIPDEIDGKKVTAIGIEAFYNLEDVDITSVVIPDSVVTINDGAFRGCDELTTVKLPASLTEIGERAFRGCSKLTGIDLPDILTTIGKSAFSYCGSIGNVVIPSSVTDIGDDAFAESGISGVTLPDSITEIPGGMFYGCRSLTGVVIPDSVITIGRGAFEYCEGLASVEIPDSVTSIGDSAFGTCKSLTGIVIPDSAVLGTYVLGGCDALVSVKLPSTLTSIKAGTFVGDEKLVNIEIPNTVTSIGDSAFEGCKKLFSITIPEGVTRIDVDAFAKCESLTSIIVPDGVSDLPTGVFQGCKSLSDVTLPKELLSIGNDVFKECTKLAKIEIPDTVTGIGISAFEGCTKLNNVILPSSLTKIRGGVFSGCTALTSIEVPASVTEMESGVFYHCTKLSSAKIYGQIKVLERITFEGCTALTDVELPFTLEEIGNSVFEDCASLKSVAIPPSVEKMGYDVFRNCGTGLTIRCEEDSKALQYAIDNNIKYEQVVVDPVIDLSKRGTVTGIEDKAYTGKPVVQSDIVVTAKPKVAAGEERPADFVLEENKDYEVSYDNNINVGEATITITGIGDYKGTITKTFKIDPMDITADSSNIVVSGIEDKMYTGWDIYQDELEVAIVNELATPTDAAGADDTDTSDKIVLSRYYDYTVEYSNNVEVGEATISITGKHYYSGTITKTFQIFPADVQGAEIYGVEDADYTGSAILQNNIRILVDGRRLTNGTDYTVSYVNNTNAGTAKVLITGKGNYTGTAETTFKINSVRITEISGITDKTYTGAAIVQSTIVVKAGDKILTNGTDYTVTYGNNVKVGTANVTVTGKGNYTGTINKTFTINKAPVPPKPVVVKPVVDISKKASNISVSGVKGMTYTGKSLKLKSLAVKQGTKILKVNRDYTVTYKNNKNIGTASVTIKGKGGYKGSITKTFKISVKKNKVYTVGKFNYKVTNAATNGKGTVELAGTTYKTSSKKFTSLTVDSTVKIGGKSFKVTAVGKNAFKNYKYLKEVTLGKNVTTVGKNAFSGCKKLASVKISSTKLTSVGSKAFSGIAKKPVVKTAKSKRTAYKKLLKKSGMPDKASYQKL